MRKNLLLILLFNITLAAFAQVPSYVPTNGLVGWWPFNGNANDSSGNGNHCNVIGAALTTDRFNNSDAAFDFDGINDQIIKNAPNNMPISNSKYSISAWFKSDFSKDRGTLLGWGEATNPKTVNVIMLRPDLITHYHWQYDNSISVNLNNKWHHVAITYDQSKKVIYVDGKFIQSFTAQNLNVNSNNLFFGKSEADPNQTFPDYFKGKIDDIGIWNRALDSNEVRELYVICNTAITQQPVNKGMYSGNAQFSCITNDTLVSYQWQTELGTGWNNLSNAGQYSGATTKTLQVANVTISNNNQKFRCIIIGKCLTDTSQISTLSVWGLGINGVNLPEFKLYPNPSSNAVTIAYAQNPYSIAVYNSLGQMVLSHNALTNEHTFDISQWPKGVYYVELTDAATQTNKVQKLIRN